MKWFNTLEGYGFIKVDGMRDVFVHFTSIIHDGYKTLNDGDHVEFELTDLGFAKNVRKID